MGPPEGNPPCFSIIGIGIGIFTLLEMFFNRDYVIQNMLINLYVGYFLGIIIGLITLWMILSDCPIEYFKLNLTLVLICLCVNLGSLLYGLFVLNIILIVSSEAEILLINIISFSILCISLIIICLYIVKIYSEKKFQARSKKEEEERRIKGLIKTDIYRIPPKIHEIRGIINEKELELKKIESRDVPKREIRKAKKKILLEIKIYKRFMIKLEKIDRERNAGCDEEFLRFKYRSYLKRTKILKIESNNKIEVKHVVENIEPCKYEKDGFCNSYAHALEYGSEYKCNKIGCLDYFPKVSKNKIKR